MGYRVVLCGYVCVILCVAVSRVCAVAQYAVLEANTKVNGRGLYSHLHHSTNFDVMSNVLPLPPRELMCKIWLESIRPLRICACVKKHVFCEFF